MSENPTKKDRLKLFVKEQRISYRAFESLCGLSRGYFLSCKEISDKMLGKIKEAYPQLNVDWVLTGKGKMFDKGVVGAAVGIGLSQDDELVAYRLRAEMLKMEAQLELYKQLYKEGWEEEKQLREQFGALGKELETANRQLEALKKEHQQLEQEFSNAPKRREVG